MAYGKKEFNFYTHPWESFLFFDIETVARVPELMEDTPLYDSFMYKMRYAEEAQRKDFSAYNLKALYASKAALYPEFGKVVAISVGKIVEGKLVTISFADKDEAKLLTKFFTALNRWATEDSNLALCGVNLKFFDLRYLFIRGVVNQIEPVKKHINLTGLKPWEVFTADLTEVWKQTSPYNAPLMCMAECLGLPSPKDDIDGSQVSETYWKGGDEGLQRIATYCTKDIVTAAQIARKLRFEPLLEVATKEEVKKVKEDVKQAENAPEELPPLLEKAFNAEGLTKVDEDVLITRTRKASMKERGRLIDIVDAITGKEPLDENFVNEINKK